MQENAAEISSANDVATLFELLEKADVLFARAESLNDLDAMKARIFQEVDCRYYARRLALEPLMKSAVANDGKESTAEARRFQNE